MKVSDFSLSFSLVHVHKFFNIPEVYINLRKDLSM